MSSLKNALPRRAHQERAQPSSRKKFGMLEKHKDYVQRAKVFHRKEETLRKLKEKASNRNEDEFNFKMIGAKTVNGVHKSDDDVNKYTQEQLLVMKTQDIGYVIHKLQKLKKKVENLTVTLHFIDHPPSNKHIYFAEDRDEAKELRLQLQKRSEIPSTSDNISINIKRETARSYRELVAKKAKVKQLEEIYLEMTMQKELMKKGKKRKLRKDEIVNPTTKPVYKWHAERKH